MKVKINNGVIMKIVIPLIIAAVLGVFGFANHLDNRVNAHDVDLARQETQIENQAAMLERMDAKLDRLLERQ